jgi:hypothetical protein
MANEKRLIDANALLEKLKRWPRYFNIKFDIEEAPTVDAVEVVHGRWVLTAHEEYSNCRWNVTAECSKCNHSKGEIYAGFFTGFPKDLARDVVLDWAKSVKLDNYCPNCGADMRERKDNG